VSAKPGSKPNEKSRYEDPERFLIEVVSKAEGRLGAGTAEVVGAAAGAMLALFMPFGGGMLLRGVIGSAVGSLVGKKVSGREKDSVWFKRRLELVLDRFEEINRLHADDKCTEAERNGYVDDLVERFFDRNDSLLE
jgi:hypothetical protein